jgi:hypothetical protein
MAGAGRTLTWRCRGRRDGADLRPATSNATHVECLEGVRIPLDGALKHQTRDLGELAECRSRCASPPAMLVNGGRAAASVAVVPADADGTPWQTQPLWHPERVDWSTLLSPGSTIEPVPAFMLPAGTRVPEFDPSGGSRNWLGVFLLTAADAPTLLRDCRFILDGLEGALSS